VAHADVAAEGDGESSEHSDCSDPRRRAFRKRPDCRPGLISQNGNPPYAVAHQEVRRALAEGRAAAPSNLRAPGKIANGFAVESFTDELAAAARRDALEFRLGGLSDPRGIEVVKRAAALIGWRARPSPGPGGIGRGLAYLHYKNNETYVAMAMEVEVDSARRDPRAARRCARTIADSSSTRMPCACRSKARSCRRCRARCYEEVRFDPARVTSVDFASYPLLRFPDVPDIAIDLVIRPTDPPLGAGEAARRRFPPRLRMPSSTRRESACARCHSRPSA
jgi:hypothetical protein